MGHLFIHQAGPPDCCDCARDMKKVFHSGRLVKSLFEPRFATRHKFCVHTCPVFIEDKALVGLGTIRRCRCCAVQWFVCHLRLSSVACNRCANRRVLSGHLLGRQSPRTRHNRSGIAKDSIPPVSNGDARSAEFYEPTCPPLPTALVAVVGVRLSRPLCLGRNTARMLSCCRHSPTFLPACDERKCRRLVR